MKSTFFQVGKKEIFLELVQNPAYSFNVKLPKVFDINQDIIQVYDNKKI